MVKALIDTNVLIDFLNGVGAARKEIEKYDDAAMSIVTWMEVLVGAPREAAQQTRDFLSGFSVVALDQDVAERAVELRQEHRLKLPDAIIWASAQVEQRLLVTRNTKDFPESDPGVRMPYRL